MDKKTVFIVLIAYALAIMLIISIVVWSKAQENNNKINIIRDDLKYLDSQTREILNKLHEQEGNMG